MCLKTVVLRIRIPNSCLPWYRDQFAALVVTHRQPPRNYEEQRGCGERSLGIAGGRAARSEFQPDGQNRSSNSWNNYSRENSMWISNGRESAIAQTLFNYGRRSVQMLLTTDSETAFLTGRMSRVDPLTMNSLAGST